MKIDRLLAMTVMMLNRRKVTAKELSEQFGVSLRTVYRDVETMNSAGIPVVSWQGYDGGFTIPDSYKLSRQLFTFDDLVSVLSTLKGVNKTLQNSDISAATETLQALIPDDKEELYERHNNSFMVDISPWGGSSDLKEHISDIHQAISDSFIIKFSYRDSSGSESFRRVEPHTLVYKGYGWYLLAYCCLRNGFRIFKLNRIDHLEICNDIFQRRKVEPDLYFNQNQDSRAALKMILRFHDSMTNRVEEMFSRDSISADEEGMLRVSTSLPEDEWLYSMILSFGEKVEIISPQCLREKIGDKIKKMQKLYRNLT